MRALINGQIVSCNELRRRPANFFLNERVLMEYVIDHYDDGKFLYKTKAVKWIPVSDIIEV